MNAFHVEQATGKMMSVRPIRTEDYEALGQATLAEHADCIAPTHVLEESDGVIREIVGYGSAGKIGILAGWTSVNVSDEVSLAALRAMEVAAKIAGVKLLAIACPDNCRFKPFLESVGYTAGEEPVTLYFKKAS